MTFLRSSFLLSLALHGVAVGAVWWVGTGVGQTRRAALSVQVCPSEPAVALEEPTVVPEPVEVECAADRPELLQPRDHVAPPVEPTVYELEVQAQFVPGERLEPVSAWLTAVRPRVLASGVAMPPAPTPTRPAPAALVLEVIPGQNPPPEYPWLARRRGWEGVVAIFLHVDAQGTVDAASVARSSGHAVLDAAALAAVRLWRFCGGPGETTQEVEFVLRR